MSLNVEISVSSLHLRWCVLVDVVELWFSVLEAIMSVKVVDFIVMLTVDKLFFGMCYVHRQNLVKLIFNGTQNDHNSIYNG